ncbi:MAG: bifunctional hydroxymethylpyrimidine kinase/phosphomethylpyrimidine kinase [Myxococcota bacterium]|jgi:hydroxymethylpyrimidine/phosphomethylpyrimidine kinase|nr:bifunctional hydroxymethylpyrimidine kinase/phosphomethylpyrimidine kinase [Myxococcota bacterium]
MSSALTIAGSDPTGGAGLQADLQVFAACQLQGSAVVTALTVQDSAKVHRVLPVFPSVVLDQLRVLLADTPPAAAKLGMLATDDVARSVQLGLADLPAETPIVVDPVLAASDGSSLLESRAERVLLELVGRSALVTPNLVEAERLTGIDVSTRSGCERAAREFVEAIGAQAVLVKGGHRAGAPDDLLALREGASIQYEWLEGERFEGGPVHGTGCALSAAITAHLARKKGLRESVQAGRLLVAEGIRDALSIGSGARRLALPGILP